MQTYSFRCLVGSLCFIALLSTHSQQFEAAAEENTRPIVGILSQDVSNIILRKYPNDNFKSYIAASYVKFVEGAGGRVVPIWIGRSRDYYEDILTKVNGVIFPGGATSLRDSGYADAGNIIFNIAKEMNDRGIYLPIWGTCLGFEMMARMTAVSGSPLTNCSSSSQALPLEFEKGYEKSRLFGDADSRIIEILSEEPVTANFHIFCITPQSFSKRKLDQSWTALSVNHDWNGIEFISSMEHKQYPFFGVQFHPEKNLYEFIPNRNITHTPEAIRASQYFADFFVNEARKNPQSFANKDEEMNSLIYNYKPEYTGSFGSVFEQQYLFTGPQQGWANSVNTVKSSATEEDGAPVYNR